MIAFGGQKKGWAMPRLISFGGLIQNFRRASPPLSYGSPPGSKRAGDWYDLRLHLLWGSLEGGEKKHKPCSLPIGKLMTLDLQNNTKFPNREIKRAYEINSEKKLI